MTLYFDLSLMNVKILGVFVFKFVRHAFHILYLMYYWWSSKLDRGVTSPDFSPARLSTVICVVIQLVSFN